jgi:NAD(P)-dependent dehydrogenase (short-subunit alcohol dehydrogenase family)
MKNLHSRADAFMAGTFGAILGSHGELQISLNSSVRPLLHLMIAVYSTTCTSTNKLRKMTPDKSILITGCSSGIGLCVARGLQERGYQVFASTRQKEDVAKLKEMGLNSLQLDLDDSISIQNAVKQVLQETGGTLYALFNNGAYGQPGAVEDLTRDVLRAQFESNLFGWVELTNMLLPVMRKQGYGRIIQNSSILGLVAMPFRGAYNSTKFALEGLTDTLRQEVEHTSKNIYISLIEPGPIESDFRKNALLAFNTNIDRDKSVHRDLYQILIDRLAKEGPTTSFTEPPEAVLKRVIHALESRRPKARYYVTIPTYVFAYLRMFLPGPILDNILKRF